LRRALCLLREAIHYRKDAFCRGLRACGYQLVPDLPYPTPDDLLVIWNRYGGFDSEAMRFEAAGARVLVVENGYLGKAWRGGNWYSLAEGHHCGAGRWNVHGHERWDAIGADLEPWREPVGGPLILQQRGIGERKVASPSFWAEKVQRKIGGRIRPHPGKHVPRVPLDTDVLSASCVVTWNSSAALFALMRGVPVFYEFARWIGAGASRPLSAFGDPKRSDEDRLAMFRRLAWSIWTLDEVAEGIAIDSVMA